MKKQKTQQNSQALVVSVVILLMVLLIGAVFGISKIIASAREAIVPESAEAILASAGVEEGADINLTVRYVDQKQDECVNLYDDNAYELVKNRQFEWSSCGYDTKALEQGLVDFELGEDYLPVAHKGHLVANRGINDMTRWFEAVEGKSKEYAGSLQLKYHVLDDGPEFYYENVNFYPLDDVEFSKDDAVNEDKHNHLFTMNFVVPFMVRLDGNEKFAIEADDDTFVFVGDKLALDMGGIHDSVSGKFEIRKNGEIYTGVNTEELAYSGITINENGSEVIRIFHADRDSADSVFNVRFKGMNLAVMETEFAGTDGVQVAYDPNDPSYVAPLGQSETIKPHSTKQYVIMMSVFAIVVVVLSMLVAMLAYRYVRNNRLK